MKFRLLIIIVFSGCLLNNENLFAQSALYPGTESMPDNYNIPLEGAVVDTIYEMPDADLKAVMHWIKLRVIAVKVPYCYRQSDGRGVGVVRSECGPDLEKDGLFCYPKCKTGEKGIANLCWKPCPSTYTDNGLTCGRNADTKSAPSTLATCPSGYTNTGLTCYRGPDTYSAPSTVANCPEGYTNMGATCYRGPDTYTKGCTTIFKAYPCKGGYTDNGCFCGRGADSKDMNSMTCPPDRFRTGGRCYVICRDGYTNNGEFCGRGADTKSMSSMTCPAGYFQGADARCHQNCPEGYTNTGETCYRGPSTVSHDSYSRGAGEVLQCPTGTIPDETGGPAGLCYTQCKTGFHGVGPVCWQDCTNGMVPCGAGCALNNVECGSTTFDQVFSVAVLAANIATFGEATAVTDVLKAGEEAIKVGTQSIKVTSRVGKAAAKLVAQIKGVDKVAETAGLIWYKKIIPFALAKGQNAVNTPFKVVKMLKTISKKIYDFKNMYNNAFEEDFAQETSTEINEEINKNFNPTMAAYVKKAWSDISLNELMVTDVIEWGSTAFSLLSVADPTGIMGVVSAYGKPQCQDLIAFPTLSANYK